MFLKKSNKQLYVRFAKYSYYTTFHYTFHYHYTFQQTISTEDCLVITCFTRRNCAIINLNETNQFSNVKTVELRNVIKGVYELKNIADAKGRLERFRG